MNRESGIAPIMILLIAFVVVGVGGGAAYVMTKNKAEVAVNTPTPTPSLTPTPEMKPAKRLTVGLSAQNNSNQSGEAVLTEIDGKVTVQLQLTAGAKDVAQPAHIHLGACPKPGAVKYPLTSVVNGYSETKLDVSLNDLTLALPLAVNVHKSSTESGTYVACGNLTGNAILDIMLDVSTDVNTDVNGSVNTGVNNGIDAGVKVDLNSNVNLGLKNVKEFTMTSWYEMKDGKPATFFSLKEMKVKKGDTVRVKITNTKGNHDFVIDEYGIKKATPLNEEVVVEFVADKAGKFKYYCSMPNHRMMGQEGDLIVEE